MYFYIDYCTVESASLKPKVERDRGYAWVVLTASFMWQVGNCLVAVDSLIHSSERASNIYNFVGYIPLQMSYNSSEAFFCDGNML